MRGFATLAGEEGIVALDAPPLLPPSTFPQVLQLQDTLHVCLCPTDRCDNFFFSDMHGFLETCSLRCHLDELPVPAFLSLCVTFDKQHLVWEQARGAELQGALAAARGCPALTAPALLAAAAAAGLVHRPGTGAVFSRRVQSNLQIKLQIPAASMLNQWGFLNSGSSTLHPNNQGALLLIGLRGVDSG